MEDQSVDKHSTVFNDMATRLGLGRAIASLARVYDSPPSHDDAANSQNQEETTVSVNSETADDTNSACEGRHALVDEHHDDENEPDYEFVQDTDLELKRTTIENRYLVWKLNKRTEELQQEAKEAVESYEKDIGNLTAKINESESESKKLQSELDILTGLLDESKSKSSHLQREYDQLAVRESQVRKENTSYSSRIVTLEGDMRQYESKSRQFEDQLDIVTGMFKTASEEKQDYRVKLEQLQTKLDLAAKEKMGLEAEIEELKRLFQLSTDAVLRYNGLLEEADDKAKEKRQSYEKKLKRKDQEREALVSTFELEKKTFIDKTRKQNESYENMLKERDQERERLVSAFKTEEKVLNDKIQEQITLVKRTMGQAGKIQAELQKVTASKQASEDRVSQLEKQSSEDMQKLEEKLTDIAAVEARQRHLETELSREREEAKQNSAEIQAQFITLESQKRHLEVTLSQKLEEAEQNSAKLQAKVDTLEAQKHDLEARLSQEAKEAKENSAKLQVQIATMETQYRDRDAGFQREKETALHNFHLQDQQRLEMHQKLQAEIDTLKATNKFLEYELDLELETMDKHFQKLEGEKAQAREEANSVRQSAELAEKERAEERENYEQKIAQLNADKEELKEAVAAREEAYKKIYQKLAFQAKNREVLERTIINPYYGGCLH